MLNTQGQFDLNTLPSTRDNSCGSDMRSGSHDGPVQIMSENSRELSFYMLEMKLLYSFQLVKMHLYMYVICRTKLIKIIMNQSSKMKL